MTKGDDQVRSRWVAPAFAAFAIVFTGGSARAQVPALPTLPTPADQLQYQIRTVWQGQERFTSGVLLAPVPVDVNGDLEPDVSVQVIALPATPLTGTILQASFTKLPTMPGGTLSVETIFAVDAGVGRDRFAFGYDAQHGVPDSFGIAAAVAGGGFNVQMNTSTSAPDLAVLGSLYHDASGTRVNAKRATVTMAPVPPTLAVSADSGPDSSFVQVTPSVATTAAVDFSDTLESHQLLATGSVTLPAGQTRIEWKTGDTNASVHYIGTAPIDDLQADVRQIEGGNLVKHVFGHLTGIHTNEVQFIKDGDKHVSFNLFGGSIDRTEIAIGSNHEIEPISPIPSGDYLKLVMPEPQDQLSVAARVDGLSNDGSISFENPIHIHLSKTKRPFRLEAYGIPMKWALRAVADINDLPASIDLTVAPNSSQVFSYTADAPIDLLQAGISDSAPLFGRVRSIKGLVLGIPSSLTLTLAPTGSGFSLDTGGGVIGSIEAVMSSDPNYDERLPSGYYGVLVRDNPTVFDAAVRLGGIKSVTANFTPGCDQVPSDCTSGAYVSYDSIVDNGTMWVALRGAKPSGVEEQTDVTVSGLPRSVAFLLTDRIIKDKIGSFSYQFSKRRNITYRASGAGGSVSFSTNQGRPEPLSVSLAPIPASIDLCMASDAACDSGPKYGTAANRGSLNYIGSSEATLNLTDCVSNGCNERTEIQNLKLTRFTYELDSNKDALGLSYGHVYASSGGYAVAGHILTRDAGGGGGMDINLPDGFWLDNRLMSWSASVSSTIWSGTAHCPSGTAFFMPIFGNFRVDVSGFIC